MGYLPIHCAASKGYLAIVKYFIKLGVDVNTKTEVSTLKMDNFFYVDIYSFVKDNRTLLQIAASQGHEDIVEYLLEKHVDVNYQDKV